MTPVLLHLMRHGAPVTPGLMMGRTDGAPDEAGIAACIARAADLSVEAVASSDLVRAVEPARRIAAARGLAHHVDPGWRELDFGAWDGLAAADVDPDALGRFWSDPDANPPPEGERWSALVARVVAALPSRSTLIVTHGGAMRAALAGLCGFSLAQCFAFDFPYAACLTLRLWPGDPQTAQIVALRP